MSAPIQPPPDFPGSMSGVPDKTERTLGMLCHLLALCMFTCIPFANIFGPLVLWLIKKDDYPFVDDQGKESVNFQITMSLVYIACGLVMPVGGIGVLLVGDRRCGQSRLHHHRDDQGQQRRGVSLSGLLAADQIEGAMPDDPDQQAVAAARSGDFAAFESLVARHERRVYRVAARIVGRRHDAEEIVQQTFLSVVEHLDEFRGESSFATWLMRIATNHALVLLRRRAARPTVPLDERFGGTPVSVGTPGGCRIRNTSPRGAHVARGNRLASRDAADPDRGARGTGPEVFDGLRVARRRGTLDATDGRGAVDQPEQR